MPVCFNNEGRKMTPQQTQVWTRYHKANETLADATDTLIRAQQAMRAGLVCNTTRYEQIAIGALAEYRACRAAMEALR